MFLYNCKEPAVKSALCRFSLCEWFMCGRSLHKKRLIFCRFGLFCLSSQINKSNVL